MNKENASKLWKIIQEAGDYLLGQLPDHPNHPKGRNPYAHVAICVKSKFNASYKDIPDDQLDAYISNDVWLRNAKHANAMGKKLSDGLSKHNDIEIAYPTEANEVFAKFPREKIEHLNSEGYKMNEEELDGKAIRLVAAWNTKESDVDELLNTIKAN